MEFGIVSSWWPAGGALSWCSVELTSVAAVLIKNKDSNGSIVTLFHVIRLTE